MKKSIIAAAFAASLPMGGAMAQGMPETQGPEQSDDACVAISATAEFCANANAQPFGINTPEGLFIGVPGRVEDGDVTHNQCIMIVQPQVGPVGVQCAPEPGPE